MEEEAGAVRPSADRIPRVRVLLFSDVQLDRPYEWASATVADARRASAREALVELLGVARSNAVDVVACAGNLFDRRGVRPSTTRWLTTALRSAGVPVLIAPGDHDFVGPLGGYLRHQWPENVTIFDSDRFTPVDVAENVTIWGAAHTEAHRLGSFLDGFEVDRGGVNFGLFHGTERSGFDREPATEPSAPFDEIEIEATGFDHALVGHFQQAHLGSTHTYPGAPIAHDFENGATGSAVLLTLDEDGTIARELIEVSSPGLHVVEVDLTNLKSASDVLKHVNASLSERSGITHLRLVGRLEPDIVLRREDLLGLIATPDDLHISWEVDVDVDLDQMAKEQNVLGQFVRDVLAGGNLSEERQQHVLLIGLRALAGSDVLEGPR
jgi:exonuclease SbcD